MNSLQWVYDKHLKPLEDLDGLTFEILHQNMLKAKWEYFETLSQDEAEKFIRRRSNKNKDFYRKLLEINEQQLSTCGLTFQQFYEKVITTLNSLPVGGGILLDPTYTKILLVKFVSGKYDIPRGKIDPGESVQDAAVRNIKNRTGYSATLDEANPLINQHKEHLVTLYFVPNVPVDFQFSPRYDKVILSAEFFDLDKIRSNRYYGTTGKQVTYIVTRNLDNIKTYCRKMIAQNSDLT